MKICAKRNSSPHSLVIIQGILRSNNPGINQTTLEVIYFPFGIGKVYPTTTVRNFEMHSTEHRIIQNKVLNSPRSENLLHTRQIDAL